MTSPLRSALVFVSVFAFHAGTHASPPPPPPPPPPLTPPASSAASSPARSPPPGAPAKAIDVKTMCTDNALLLTVHSFKSLQDGAYCKLCKPFDEMACELDWPFSDVPSCKAYDEMRNGIFAAYGRTFEKEEWRALFATRPWYKPDPHFDESRMSAVAKENVAFLKKAATEKIACQD